MTDLFWPGDERADGLLDDAALLSAMVGVEQAWLEALAAEGVAPEAVVVDLSALVSAKDVPALSLAAESGGNPVIGLISLLRERTDGETSRWLHRGLTSQDVVDTALVLTLRDAVARVDAELRTQLTRLADLAEQHRDDPMVGRTLTQHAVPITVGAKLSGWITSLADARDALCAARPGLVIQVGGAAGTLAAPVELTGDVEQALTLVERTARTLGLSASPPWHTARSPFTRVGDALVTCTDAWGHVAADVATLSRPELAELAEGSGGGSSTMPHKANPVLSVLLRRTALCSPSLAATLHLAAATTVDERPDGAWHAEWSTLQQLGRRTVVAASHATELLGGLRISTDRMRENLATAAGTDTEQRSMAALTGREPGSSYSGTAGVITDAAVRRVRTIAEDLS
ncbi:lyase family protein [Aeromicrobium sp. CTD01-1L150]|uniref:lyase family protein n=1 Tax=Aeromicrobium sp. CTD01-1L150 TaxID=3341830 RepID=UPI0035BFC2C1